MEQRLTGKVIIVTGAESGIGRAITIRCAAEGARVTAAGLAEAGLKETARLAGSTSIIMPLQTDIRNPEQVQTAVERTVSKFGRLDAAVANAGISAGTAGPFIDTDLDAWNRTIETNLTGTFITLRAAARVLVAQGEGGSLLATGSSTAIRPKTHAYAYMASKAGIHQLMRALAVDLAPYRIRVNTIVPGGTETPLVLSAKNYAKRGLPMVPMKELVQPEEIASFVAFALSNEAPHMTGTLLKIDSGRTSL